MSEIYKSPAGYGLDEQPGGAPGVDWMLDQQAWITSQQHGIAMHIIDDGRIDVIYTNDDDCIGDNEAHLSLNFLDTGIQTVGQAIDYLQGGAGVHTFKFRYSIVEDSVVMTEFNARMLYVENKYGVRTYWAIAGGALMFAVVDPGKTLEGAMFTTANLHQRGPYKIVEAV